MTTAAIIGSAVIGGVASERAGSKAAKAQERSAESIERAAQIARQDVLNLFPQAQLSLLTGAQGAFDVFGKSIPLQQSQLQAGNLAAQQSVSDAFNQAQAALLGQPVTGFGENVQGVSPYYSPVFTGSILGEPVPFFTPQSGATQNLPTFAGLGGTFRPALEPDPLNPQTFEPLPEFGQGGQGTPIQNPGFFFGNAQTLPGFGQVSLNQRLSQDPNVVRYQGGLLGT